MHSLSFELLILIRVIAACILGSAIGLERELTNKYAGLRTHILVCLGSAIFTVLSIYAFPTAVNNTNPQAFGDPARIAAQVLTGIGFIGGGTVLRHGSSVHGLTTAATLWVAAAIGMACGSGMLDVATITTVFSVIVLVLIRLFERNVLVSSTKNLIRMKIIITCQDSSSNEIYNYIVETFSHTHEISKKRNEKKENQTKIIAITDVNARRPLQLLYKTFEGINGIESISIQEDNE